MFVAILFCLLMCPHDSFGAEQGCRVCAAGFECQDLCDCQNDGPQHQCALDSLHSHEFRNDTPSTANFDFSKIDWVYVALLLEEPHHLIHHSDSMARFSSHSFAVRHLDTIILRV